MRRNMTLLRLLIGRNMQLYFKDKITFFTSLLTPLILLVLFVTFLRSVYADTFTALLPEGVVLSDRLLNGFTGGWLMSSILGVSAVTIAFCSNIVMVQDKINGSLQDLLVTPVRRDVLAVGYYLANLCTTLTICLTAMLAGFGYLAAVGWYLSAWDVAGILVDVLLCILFGVSLAAFVEQYLSSQGGISAVATLVSSLYGFLCGAYMPISQFAAPIRNFVAFIPGTYGVALMRGHYMNGVLEELSGQLPASGIQAIRDSFDGNLYFFGNQVRPWQMYAVLVGAFLLFLGLYIVTSRTRRKRA